MMATLGELSVTISLYQIIIDRPTNQLTDGHEIAFNHVFNQPGGESCIAEKKTDIRYPFWRFFAGGRIFKFRPQYYCMDLFCRENELLLEYRV